MKSGTFGETTLEALRKYSEGPPQDGWRDIYLDFAAASEQCATLTPTGFRDHLSNLYAHGVYRPIDGITWGKVRMND
jgi:hypothetical protein